MTVREIDVTLTLDTSIYADGDVLAATQAVPMEVGAVLQSIYVLDEDDQGVAFDLFFLNANQSFGAENAAAAPALASAQAVVGMIQIQAADYVDWGSYRTVWKGNLGLALQPGATGLFVAAITRGGTPTYSATGIKLKLGILEE